MAIMTKTEYRIAYMKLQELRQQRPRLFQTYVDLGRQVEQEQGKMQQLQTLFTGLQKIKMLEVALHPDVANLEPLFNGPQLSDETVSFWHAELAKDLSQGRVRSELIYIFGALLEEWVQEKSQEMAPDPAGIEAYEQFLDVASHPSESAPDSALLDTLFTDRNFMGKNVATWFQQTASDILRSRITSAEMGTVLERFQARPQYTALIRREAKSLAQDLVLCGEMADALSIYLTHLDEWDWPAEGVSGFPLWTMNKWRLFISYDFFTMCFLEILGTRLQNVFQQFLNTERQERSLQLTRFLNESFVDNAEDQIEQSLHLYRLANNDIWKNLMGYPDAPLTREDLKTHVSNYSNYHSIISSRREIREGLQDASTTLSGYDKPYEGDSMGSTLQFINAEIELTRAAFPEAPLYVLKIDLSAFYPTLPHELLLAVLERYGFSQSDLAFFRKVLEVRVRHGEDQIRFRRGVPLLHSFSNVLGEMVLHLLDQHILRSAHVQIIRMVDDICILASSGAEAVQAWQAAVEFCRGTGLTINQEKCGAVCIQGELPEQLPVSLPSWLFVKLDPNGAWQVDMEAFATYHQQVREQVLQYPSLLSQIEVYNQHVKHLIRAAAMESDLGKAHRLSIEQVAALFHHDFFQQGYGMLEALRKNIQERFFGNDTAVTLPEAWFYWPITAGGCGLTQVMILASGYAETHTAAKERSVPEKRALTWQSESNDWWYLYYSSFIWHVHLKEPESTKRMEMLVNDFIQRSNEVGHTWQTTLGPYWRWILYIYGPQILLHLGSFRFLITELVPLQLILQHFQHVLGSDDKTTLASMDTPF